MALIDTDNLSYVAKNYENEVKETARRMYAQDTVNNTIARVNEKLDKLITSINAKYDFMRDKMYGAGGIDDFVKSTHKDIDNISTDFSDFVDTNLQNTKSHPSINAFKIDRSYSAYKMFDFKNQSIKLNKDTLTLSLKNIRDLNPSRKLHTFRINLDSEEALKIVEFAITYRQDPNLITISDNEVYKEPTVQIERVIKGKFFIIRHDPINEPSQIIVKAIIDNTDNTSNVLNEDIIDIPASLDGKTVSHTDEGPEFDLYFKVSSQNTLDICIGNIVPYKWLIQKNYVTIDDLSDKKEFSIVSHNVSHIKVSKVAYAKSLGLFFIVDEESRKIYTTSDNSLEMSTLTQFTRLEYDGRFEVFDTGSICVISNNEASIIFTNDITQGKYLGTRIYNAKNVSTGEIVVNVGNNSLYLIDTDSIDLGIKLIDLPTEEDFENSIEYFEYEPGVLMCFVGRKDTIICYIFKTNISTNTYADSEYRSNPFEHRIERLSGINCVSGKIFAIQKIDNSIIIPLTYKSASDNEISSVIKFSDFTIDNRDITFNSIEVLKKFNISNKEFSSFSDIIAKVVSTSLFDFAITNENKLLIIDDKYIIDALTFTKETKEVQVIDSKGNTSIEIQDLGYSDKNSVLFMRPNVNESQYYNSNEIFLQNVFDVFENQDRVYICDKYGIYELQPNKNLKNRFYSQNGKIYNIVSNIVNQNVSYGLLYCKSSDDTSVSVFKHNYEVKDVSDEKLRYNYIDLHNSDWQIFDPENLVYDPNKKIIEMNGIIYVSIVDRMSSLFNTNKNINYSTSLNVFEDIDPNIVHTNQFVVDGNNVVKEVPVVKFNFTVNKYGIVNYYGFQLKDGIKNVSDINELKSYILIHKPTDGLTLNDYRKVIINKLKEEALEDHDPQTIRKYILNPDKPKRLVYAFSKPIGNSSFDKVIDIKGRKYGMMSIDTLLPGNKYKYIDSNFMIDDLFVNVCNPITGKNFAYELNLITEMTKNGLYQYNLDLKTQNVKLRYRKDYSSDSFDPTYQDGMFEKVVGSINDIITNFDYDLFDKKNKYFDILEVQNNDFLIYRGPQTIKYVSLRDSNGKVIIFDDTAISESNPFGSDICGEDSSIVFNRFKIINNELYLWSDKAKLGLYKFNTVTKIAEVVLNKAILDYIIDDVIINENNQIIATINSNIDKNTDSYKKYMYTKIIDNVINNILNNSKPIKLISDPNNTDYKHLDPDLLKFGISIIYSFKKLVSTSDSITIPSIEIAEPTSNMLTYVNQFITTANNCVKLIDSSYVLFDDSPVVYQATETNGWSGYAIVKSKVHTKDSFDFTFKTRPANFFENKYTDAILIENAILKTIINPNSNIHGLTGRIVCDIKNENYILGLCDGIAIIDKNDFNKIKYLKLKTVIGRDIPFIPKIINGSLFVVANENILSDRIYKLTYDHVIKNYVPEEYSFMDPEDTSCRMNVKDFIDLNKYGCYLIAENTETGKYNYYQYVSENKTAFGENVGVYVEDSSIPAVMGYNTTLKSNDNFGILIDGHMVHNFRLNQNAHINREFTNLKRLVKHANQINPEGSWITDPQDPSSKIFKTTTNYQAINGDLTKWSVAYNGSEEEHDLYYFEPNEPKTYEPVNKNITKVPLEGIEYYRKSKDQYISIGKITNWVSNTDYYRLSGTWKFATPEIISSGEKTLYFAEDIETVIIPIDADYSVDMGNESPAVFDFETVTKTINELNCNSINEITGKSTLIINDKYEVQFIVEDVGKTRININSVVEKDDSDMVLICVQEADSKNISKIWVACSYSNNGLYYSTDGKTWTQSNITSGGFYSVYYDNGIWVAGSYSDKGLYYSEDGKTWTQSNISSGNFYTVCYDNGIWVASSYSNNGLYYSTDGKTWTQSNITSGDFHTVYYDNGIWVAGCNSDKGLYYSEDGKTWTQSNITNKSFSSVYYDNGIWVASSYSNNGLYYSTDGKTWTQSNISSGNFYTVYYDNGIWVACSGNSDKGLYYSEDGKTWTQSNITSGSFYTVYYDNNTLNVSNKKSLIYDAKNSIYDIDSVKDKTNYACVFIEKLFDTSLGKFVVSNGNLHLISDDYKQIISNLDTGSENYYVYEDKSKEEPMVFTCNLTNNIVKIYSKITRKLVETPVASVKMISMFNDDNGNLYGLSSVNDKYVVYKFNDSTNVFEKIWETPSNISVNTEIGFVTRDIADDLHETFIIGNGDYNFYKFNGVDFTPVFTIYNKYNSPIVKTEVLPNADIIVKFKSDYNEDTKLYHSIIIKQNDEIKELFESNDWVSVTGPEDKVLPNGFLQNNSNIFFKEFEKMLFENKLEANNSNKLVLLPNTTCLPIVVNGELIYPDVYADPETIEQDPDNHFVVYDSDGVTPAYYNIHFDKMVETSKGIFAVAGNEIFRNDINTNGNGFFMTVGKGLRDSDYVNIIECRHGIFYCDNKNVMKFNEAENKFEVIPQTVATNSDTNKITFIECFNEGLIIASKPKHLSNTYNETQYPEFKIPGIFEWYNSSTNSFKRLYESSDLISNGFDSTNLIQIGDIKETSKGLFITLVQKNKLIVIQLYRDIFTEPSINYFSKTLDPNSGNLYNSVIANIFESEDGNIYIQHSVDFGDSSSLFASTLYILNENELESVQNKINALSIINTIEGIFGAFDSVPLVNDSPSVNSESNAKMFGKLKEVESVSTINGKQIHYLDIDDTFDPDFVNKVNEDKSYVKLCQESNTKRIFAFVFNDSVAKDGVVTGKEVYKFYLDIYELNFSTGKFELLPNSRINITDSYESLMVLSGTSNERTKKYNPYLIEDFEVLDYNGILFFKLFGNQVYRYGDYKLKYENTNVKAKRDEVLYDLKIVFENPDKYNNLPEETSNSEIDKFVIKEVGLVNPVVEKEHDKLRRVTQFFMPHNYYNRASGIVNSVIMDPAHPETGEPKEYFRVHNTKQLYNLVYNGFKRNNLINSRFIKDNQDIVSDTFVHKTNDVLGDIEKYLQNTDCFRIELRIYPAECLGTSDDHINKTIRFSDSEAPTKFKKTIVDPYDPDED